MIPLRSTKFFLTLSIVALSAAVVLYSALSWAFFAARARATARAGAETEAERARASTVALARLLSDTADKRNRADALFVASGGTPSFLKEVEDAARAAGVSASIVQVENKGTAETSATEAGVGELAVAVEARGGFQGVYGFLMLLERFPRPLSLSRVSLTRNESGVWSGVFEVRALQMK